MESYNKKEIMDEITKKMENQPATHCTQRAYLFAKAHLQALRAQEDEYEKAYIADKGIRNADGTIPKLLCAIDDMEVFNQVIEEVSLIIEGCGLWADILEAQKTLQTAEEELIAFGISLVPSEIQELIRRRVSESYSARMKMISIILHLDVSTIPRKGKPE